MKLSALCGDHQFRLAFWLNGFAPAVLVCLLRLPATGRLPGFADAVKLVLGKNTKAKRPMTLRETLDASRDFGTVESGEPGYRALGLLAYAMDQVKGQGGAPRMVMSVRTGMVERWEDLASAGHTTDSLGPPWPTPLVVQETMAIEKLQKGA